MCNFQREEWTSKFYNECIPLFEDHYKEIAHYQDIPLSINFKKYLEAENTYRLRVFTAREDGELIGYAVFFVSFNLHYSSSYQAVQDVLFIDPSTRGQGLGSAFIEWCDSQLKEEGVQVVYHHVKTAHNFGPLLESLNYELIDLIYGRRLDKEE